MRIRNRSGQLWRHGGPLFVFLFLAWGKLSEQHKKGIWTGFWFTCLGFVVIWFGGIKLSRDRILSKKYIHTSSELRH